MRRILVLLPLALIGGMVGYGLFRVLSPRHNPPVNLLSYFDMGPAVHIEQRYSTHDEDNDGVNDTQDLIDGARAEVTRQPTYLSEYYNGGYPPPEIGVCTDLVWRAFHDAGYELKQLVDADIATRPNAYPRTEGKPDPNIDFRRVPNLDVFFKKFATTLTRELKPGDAANLAEWQGGDLVLFGAPTFHIGIVSDKRTRDGVPLLLHNAGIAREDNGILSWSRNISPIIGHYRWPSESDTKTALPGAP